MADDKIKQVKASGTTLFAFLAFSILMVITPIVVFSLSYYRYFDGFYSMTFGVPDDANISGVSGIVAVIALNMVVGMFIFLAFQEEVPEVKAKKDQ